MAPAADVAHFETFILAGGASSRFGSDKALAAHEGVPLLDRAARAAAGIGRTPRIVAPEWRRYAGAGWPLVIAERPGEGPVEGLRAALTACAAPWALVLSVDMPGVTAEVLRALFDVAAAVNEADAVCFRDGARRHPFPGFYRRTVASLLEGESPPASLQGVLDAVDARVMNAGAILQDPAKALWNVNRPEDLEWG